MNKSVYIILVAVLMLMAVGDILFGVNMAKTEEQKKLGRIMLISGIAMLLCGGILLFAVLSGFTQS
ncbi:MAG: hypothetical protein PHI27_12350 [Eubacteriales bacterium]|nr:hypothetical protein [Eubacteriales bacterium]MDD3883013.1 hypothetical protein [Eubacteriales bacterium]MDD4513660.1 hypothetical protein [Eubacteriales bacterium]